MTLPRLLVCLTALFVLTALPAASGEDRKIDTSRAKGKALTLPEETPSFSFIIFADRTTGPGSGLEILRQAVKEANVIRPDFVITVGDLVSGYCPHDKWVYQMKQFRIIMDELKMPWFPVAGNHDLYWRGKDRPKTEHDDNFEAHFAPLWYSFTHKKCCFISFCTDEGDAATGQKAYDGMSAQKMSPEQGAWLTETLGRNKGAEHVFMFQHNPRWSNPYASADWKRTHRILRQAGNVSAVFAGHTHVMAYFGKTDDIEYHTLSCTGGKLAMESLSQGFLHHYDLVTVRGEEFHVATIPVGSVIDPRAGRNPLLTQPKRKVAILKKQKWSIEAEDKRILPYAFQVPDFPVGEGLLRIAIENSLDDTGDRGLCYALLDGRGQTKKSGFLSFKDMSVIDFPVPPKSKWTLLLIDQDTKLSGKKPGNAGTLQIQVNHGKPPRKKRERQGNPLRMGPQELKKYLGGKVFKFTGAGKVLNKKLILHPNGIVGHRRLAETYWDITPKGKLVFRDDRSTVSTTFTKMTMIKGGRINFEGKFVQDKGVAHVLEEVE